MSPRQAWPGARARSLPGETVVLSEVNAAETSRLLAILRDVETETPVTFAFHSPPHFRFKSSARPLGHELPSGQRLAENAARLAHEIRVSREAKPRGPSFLRRFARDRAGVGMGKRKPNDVSRSAPRLHPFGGVAAR